VTTGLFASLDASIAGVAPITLQLLESAWRTRQGLAITFADFIGSGVLVVDICAEFMSERRELGHLVEPVKSATVWQGVCSRANLTWSRGRRCCEGVLTLTRRNTQNVCYGDYLLSISRSQATL
jgi:hypothetical protein